MKFRKSMLSASIATALLFAAAAQAQGATAQDQTTTDQQQAQTTDQQTGSSSQTDSQQLQTVQVVGIRASLWQSLQTKRAADATERLVS